MKEFNDILNENNNSKENLPPSAPVLDSTVNRDDSIHRNPNKSDMITKYQSYESILVRIDRLFISRGTRFVSVLPMLVILLFGLAQSFTNSAPNWWVENAQPLIGEVNVNRGFYILALFILVADIGLLIVLFRLLILTRKIFHLQSERLTTSGFTFKSAHGYAEMKETIEGSIRQVGATTLLMFLSGIFLLLSLQLSDFTGGTPVLLALSTGALLSGHGVHMVSNRSRFNASEPWGMLDAFSPPVHPALLRRPFSDVIRAHVDPLLAVKISDYLRLVQKNIDDGSSMTNLQEGLLHLLHIRRAGLMNENEFRSSLELLMPIQIIDELFNHPELGEETWDRLLIRARNRCASFFRLHDRMRMHLEKGHSRKIWFDVDMENLVVGRANLFAFILNQGDSSVDLILRVQTPDFRPNECVYNLRIDPYEPSKIGKSNLSIIQQLPDALKSTDIIWQSLLPAHTGEATVSVRLEDIYGNLISGRVLTVQNRPDMFTRLRLTVGGLFLAGAAIVVLSPILPFFTSLIGL